MMATLPTPAQVHEWARRDLAGIVGMRATAAAVVDVQRVLWVDPHAGVVVAYADASGGEHTFSDNTYLPAWWGKYFFGFMSVWEAGDAKGYSRGVYRLKGPAAVGETLKLDPLVLQRVRAGLKNVACSDLIDHRYFQERDRCTRRERQYLVEQKIKKIVQWNNENMYLGIKYELEELLLIAYYLRG
jgi:hypothetical protein